MGVYIKNFNIPECCYQCFNTEFAYAIGCYKWADMKYKARYEGRAKDCPLVEVKTPEQLSKAKVRFEEVLDEYNISWSYGDKDKTLKTLNMFKEFIENYSINDKYVFNDTHEPSIDQEYDMTREVAQVILAYMDVHNDLESKAICMAIDALKGKEYD